MFSLFFHDPLLMHTLGPVDDVTEGSTHVCFLEPIWCEFSAIIR